MNIKQINKMLNEICYVKRYTILIILLVIILSFTAGWFTINLILKAHDLVFCEVKTEMINASLVEPYYHPDT